MTVAGVEETRFQELRQDIKGSLDEIKQSITSLRDELRTDYVGRGEYETAIGAIRNEIADMKTSSRFTIGSVLTPSLVGVLAFVAGVIGHFGR